MCPTTLALVSRWMLVFHSQLVVSGCPVPMYLAWRRSSSCCVRSLSAYRMRVSSINTSEGQYRRG